jgi:hypothetical protein
MAEIDYRGRAERKAAEHRRLTGHPTDVIQVLSGDVSASCDRCDWRLDIDPDGRESGAIT